MKKQEMEAIVDAYNNLIENPQMTITLFGESTLWRWVSEEEYETLKPLLEGQKKVVYTIGGLAIETEVNMTPAVIKDGEKVYIGSRNLNDLHDIIEWLIFSYKKIKLDALKEGTHEQINP